MTDWRVTWRPNERDFLIDREPSDQRPLIVVRPRGSSALARASAEVTAHLIAEQLSAVDRAVERSFAEITDEHEALGPSTSTEDPVEVE